MIESPEGWPCLNPFPRLIFPSFCRDLRPQTVCPSEIAVVLFLCSGLPEVEIDYFQRCSYAVFYGKPFLFMDVMAGGSRSKHRRNLYMATIGGFVDAGFPLIVPIRGNVTFDALFHSSGGLRMRLSGQGESFFQPPKTFFRAPLLPSPSEGH